MKQIIRNRKPLAVLLALCLAMQLCVPAAMASGRLMRAGDMAIEQIEEEEGFRAEKYSSGGKWYIGYGTECGAEDYPEGITREEAELLLMSKVEAYEAKLNDFFGRYDVTPTQGQFDALICFSYNFGTGWMSGTSDLVKIARGEKDATRLEVAHAFGEWCHSGGQAQAGLADRRLQEAAIYLDDGTRAAENEFAYLIINMESGTSYETDFAVYEIGKTYGSFPKAEKLGYGFAGFRTSDGKTITENSIVNGNAVVTAQWTATAAGCCVVGRGSQGPYVTGATVGRIVDLGIKDANNMGAAMAPAAVDTLERHFQDFGVSPADYDLIVTGDLGALGKQIVLEQTAKDGYDLSQNYDDCGVLLFSAKKQDVHSGGSGCGCSASVLCGYLLRRMLEGSLKNLLFCATGALLSPVSTWQGESIPGICHAVAISAERR